VNETELRGAMRAATTMAPPPAMNSAAALTAGRRAVRRRNTLVGVGGVATLVALTALAVNLGLPRLAGDGDGDNFVPAAQPSVAPTPSEADTKPAWPIDGNGQPQQDATARSGEHYNQGKELLDKVLAVVPDGWTTPTGSSTDGSPLRDHQAQVIGDNGKPPWEYLAYAAVAKDGKVGRVLAQVEMPGNGLPKEPCALTKTFWGMKGDCQVKTVGKLKVGVVVKATGDDRFNQWAAYRYADGAVVYVAQSRNESNSDTSSKALKDLPFSVDGLAALAVDARFHLTE
jgi:hypothetical protein